MASPPQTISKLIKNGQVAVIVSRGYGSGWSTWNGDFREAMVFDPEIAQALINNDRQQALVLAKAKYPNALLSGLDEAEVNWVAQGERFSIDEYDGYESLQLLGPDYGYTA